MKPPSKWIDYQFYYFNFGAIIYNTISLAYFSHDTFIAGKSNLSTSVFKFMSGEQYHIDALRDGYVYFSDFYDLNDPYEGLLDLSKEGVDDSLRMAVFANGLAIQNSSNLKKSRKIADRFLKQYGMEVVRERVDRKVEDIFCNYQDRHLKSHFVLSLGLQCEEDKFPAPLTNMMMWSHYANGMRGMCIEYDYDELLKSIQANNKDINVRTQSVVYSKSKLPRVKATTLMQSYISDKGEAGNEMINAFCTKYWAWHYENEIRFLGSKHGLVSFDRAAIKRIFISYKAPDLLKKVQRVVKETQMNLPIFIVNSMPKTYGFGFAKA